MLILLLIALLIGTLLSVPVTMLVQKRKFFSATFEQEGRELPWTALTLFSKRSFGGPETLTVLGFLSLWLAGYRGGDLFFYGILLCLLVVMSIIDFGYRIIPNELVLLTGLLGLVLQVVYQKESLLSMGAGFFLAGGLLFMVALFGPLGGGDIKFMAAMGLWLGLEGVLYAMALGFVYGGVFSLLALVLGKKTLKSTIAFGPFLALGIWSVVLGLPFIS